MGRKCKGAHRLGKAKGGFDSRRIHYLIRMDKTIYYPYNESFGFYGPPRAGKRAQQFIDHKNQFKGGNWVLHTKEQYDEWWEKKGKFLADMQVMGVVPRNLGMDGSTYEWK